MSATLDSLVGVGSWWTENSLRLLWRAVWKSLPSGPFSIIIALSIIITQTNNTSLLISASRPEVALLFIKGWLVIGGWYK